MSRKLLILKGFTEIQQTLINFYDVLLKDNKDKPVVYLQKGYAAGVKKDSLANWNTQLLNSFYTYHNISPCLIKKKPPLKIEERFISIQI